MDELTKLRANESAEKEVKHYFEITVPHKKREHFWKIAKNLKSELVKEIQSLKEQMQRRDLDVQTHCLTAKTFEAKSKELIRSVSIKML